MSDHKNLIKILDKLKQIKYESLTANEEDSTKNIKFVKDKYNPVYLGDTGGKTGGNADEDDKKTTNYLPLLIVLLIPVAIGITIYLASSS